MDKIYGPYKRNKDGRWIIIVNGKTISYPKYVYEKHHGVKIVEPWTVDHIDDDPSNNHPDNLQLLTRADNARKSGYVKIIKTFTCAYCKHEFKRGAQYKVIPGYKNYCSESCESFGKSMGV